MKAFGMEIKKQDVRDIYAEMGKEIKEGLNFNEFLGVMTARMVDLLLLREPGTPKKKS
jgi:Ca2+-binding EF-hand superfamily protein